jgi:hypothetical protein
MSQVNPDPHDEGYVYQPTQAVTARFPAGVTGRPGAGKRKARDRRGARPVRRQGRGPCRLDRDRRRGRPRGAPALDDLLGRPTRTLR